MAEEKKAADIFGLAAYGETLNTLAKGAVNGAGAFLSRICLPAAEEFGLLLRDKVSAWRAKNAVEIALKAEEYLRDLPNNDKLRAHPRLVMRAIEEGSWCDDETLQEMWAGLLATACSEEGSNEENLLFINILAQITKVQARILNYACENSKKSISTARWIFADHLAVDLDLLKEITGTADFHRLDRELDHLRSLELIGDPMKPGGFEMNSTLATISPTSFCLQMYIRSKGFFGSPLKYFGLEGKPSSNGQEKK